MRDGVLLVQARRKTRPDLRKQPVAIALSERVVHFDETMQSHRHDRECGTALDLRADRLFQLRAIRQIGEAIEVGEMPHPIFGALLLNHFSQLRGDAGREGEQPLIEMARLD